MNTPEIRHFEGAKLLGASAPMDLHSFNPGPLWGQLMPRLHTITNRTSEDLISLRTYAGIPKFGPNENPQFTYWAGVETSDSHPELSHLEIPAGTYAVFQYKGRSSDSSIWIHIYSRWLPSSPWQLDERPHFERLGTKYKNDDPESEEEIWIPVKARD